MNLFVCPGQGSQTPGFLSPWFEDQELAAYLDELADAGQIDLRRHGQESDAETIKDTRIAQPLIVAAALVSVRALARAQVNISAVAGHSVGEFAAAALAGVITPTEAMALVGVRARAMAEAAALVNTAMAAVIGGDPDELNQELGRLGLTAANFNGGGQIVVAGERSAVDRLQANPIAQSRVIALSVAGAFHTDYMRPALDAVRERAATINARDPQIPLWTNHDGSRVHSGARYLDLLVDQITQPVRWDLCMASFIEAGVTRVIELLPAGALVGLAKRAMPGVQTVAIKIPEDVPSVASSL